MPTNNTKKRKRQEQKQPKKQKECVLVIVIDSSCHRIQLYLYTQDEYDQHLKEWEKRRTDEGKPVEWVGDDSDGPEKYDDKFKWDGIVTDDMRIVSVEEDEIFTG